jgi:hypothetical protein
VGYPLVGTPPAWATPLLMVLLRGPAGGRGLIAAVCFSSLWLLSPAGVRAQQGGLPSLSPNDSSVIAIGDVVSAADGAPVAYATVSIEPGGHARFADAGGSFAIGHLAPRLYRVRARQIGFAPADTLVELGGAGPAVRIRLTLKRIAVRLPAVNILVRRECLVTGIPDSSVDADLAALFGELRKNIERYRLLVEEYPFAFTREEWRVARNDGGFEQTISLDTVAYDVRAMNNRRYKPGSILYWDVRHGDLKQIMYLPNFGDLADSVFQKSHCFQYVGEDTTSGGHPTIRVDFWPAKSIHTPDVEGSVYLDEVRYIVRRAEFRLTRPNTASPPIVGVRATTTFREIVPLVPLFDEVHYVVPAFPTGDAGTIEIDRLLQYKFYQGKPGSQAPPLSAGG